MLSLDIKIIIIIINEHCIIQKLLFVLFIFSLYRPPPSCNRNAVLYKPLSIERFTKLNDHIDSTTYSRRPSHHDTLSDEHNSRTHYYHAVCRRVVFYEFSLGNQLSAIGPRDRCSHKSYSYLCKIRVSFYYYCCHRSSRGVWACAERFFWGRTIS